MDKKDNQNNNIKQTDLPATSTDTKNVEKEANKLPDKKDESLNQTKDLTLPSLNIENSASVEEQVKKEGKSVLDVQADFQSIFNVESEETKEEKKKGIDPSAPVVKKKYEEPKPLPEEKAKTDEEKQVAKEKRKENFNGEERVIFEIQEEKEGNPIVVVLFFIALITVIFALPFISKKVSFTNYGVNGNNGTQEETGSEDEFYQFDRSSVRAKIGNLELTNFVRHNRNGNYTLTFNISNKQQKAYTFDEKYYVEFYREGSIIYRALIYSKDPIGANAITSVEIPITAKSYSESDSFKLAEIAPASYPTTTLSEVDGEYRVLTCKKGFDELRYYFLDNKLVKLKETYKETMADSSNYSTSIDNHYLLSRKYKEIENFTSTFVSSASEFTLVNEFNYKDIPDTTINNLNEYKFFRYNESKDTVKFEMEALSYNCG